MPRDISTKKREIDEVITPIPFTARLNAYHRAEEYKRDAPLLRDPFAELLAGDLKDYFEEHKFLAGRGDLQITRSYFIENKLLLPWCEKHKRSQIVLLGAGLDTRAYRFEPLQFNTHTVFEIDFPVIIQYKKKILKDEQPLCEHIRLSADLSDSNWSSNLLDRGFSSDISTFWILEGLVYYLEKEDLLSLLKDACKISADTSKVFVDVGVPALAGLDFGPFASHFKWGIDKEDVSSFFASAGWDVTSSYADEHDHGRDVGQKGTIYVTGIRAIEMIGESPSATSPVIEVEDIQAFSLDLSRRIIPEIRNIVSTFLDDHELGLTSYLDFVKRIKLSIETIAKDQGRPVSVGRISPRLLGNPLAIESDNVQRTPEEIESFVAGFLRAILLLSYCGAKGIEGDQFQRTALFQSIKDIPSTGKLESLLPLIPIIRRALKL